MRNLTTVCCGMLLMLAGPAVAQGTVPLDAAAALAATAGDWSGELQYRDYQSDTWQGLPVTVHIVAQPDGVTTVRTARFDDGPQTGMVWITTVALVDRATAMVSTASFRRGRAVDSDSQRLTMPTAPVDATHWTIVATSRRMDGDSMAQVRETTVRDGDSMTTLKEVDPEGDGVDAWLLRNRTLLTRDAATPAG
jgi:hypothetical protein